MAGRGVRGDALIALAFATPTFAHAVPPLQHQPIPSPTAHHPLENRPESSGLAPPAPFIASRPGPAEAEHPASVRPSIRDDEPAPTAPPARLHPCPHELSPPQPSPQPTDRLPSRSSTPPSPLSGTPTTEWVPPQQQHRATIPGYREKEPGPVPVASPSEVLGPLIDRPEPRTEGPGREGLRQREGGSPAWIGAGAASDDPFDVRALEEAVNPAAPRPLAEDHCHGPGGTPFQAAASFPRPSAGATVAARVGGKTASCSGRGQHTTQELIVHAGKGDIMGSGEWGKETVPLSFPDSLAGRLFLAREVTGSTQRGDSSAIKRARPAEAEDEPEESEVQAALDLVADLIIL